MNLALNHVHATDHNVDYLSLVNGAHVPVLEPQVGCEFLQRQGPGGDYAHKPEALYALSHKPAAGQER